MSLSEGIRHKGSFLIELLQNDKVIYSKKIDNLLMNCLRDNYLKLLAGKTNDLDVEALKVKYMAFGDGTTPPNRTDKKLANERYRQQITARSIQTDRLKTTVSVSPYIEDSNFNIKEIGVFCGSTATTEKDSGYLISRVLVDIDKNSNVTLNVTRYDILTI